MSRGNFWTFFFAQKEFCLDFFLHLFRSQAKERELQQNNGYSKTRNKFSLHASNDIAYAIFRRAQAINQHLCFFNFCARFLHLRRPARLCLVKRSQICKSDGKINCEQRQDGDFLFPSLRRKPFLLWKTHPPHHHCGGICSTDERDIVEVRRTQ